MSPVLGKAGLQTVALPELLQRSSHDIFAPPIPRALVEFQALLKKLFRFARRAMLNDKRQAA